MQRENILILDFGSQYTQLIARRVREQKVYCTVHPYDADFSGGLDSSVKGIILSGGPSSVYGERAPRIDASILDFGVPVLGICYGLQLLVHLLGGEVEPGTEREYGPADVKICSPSPLFAGFDPDTPLPVWMSHGDRVKELPPSLRPLAASSGAPHAAVGDDERRLYGVQFHPEVHHTPGGSQILANFIVKVCGCSQDWTPSAFIEESCSALREQVGSGQVICGLSGGVDSTVVAALLAKALPGQTICVFVDNGLLRKNEADDVVEYFSKYGGLSFHHEDASEQFLRALEGVADPERKRKIIGHVFVDVFDAVASTLSDARFLAQGTLYPDVIESVSARGGPSSTIKSHHNVGGLPEGMKLKLVEPLKWLFKDEVREVGRALGLPDDRVDRHPFPGPGLAIRVLGEVTPERCEVLREADAIVRKSIEEGGLSGEVWQVFAVLLPVKTVGVMGDERTYEDVCAVRAVTSVDGMTADWARLPPEVLARMSSRIVNEVRGINRVVYDITSKPPGTIEWE